MIPICNRSRKEENHQSRCIGSNEFSKEEVFDAAPMLKGDSPALSGQNSELIGGKKNKIIFSNTAKTISSIEDKKTVFRGTIGVWWRQANR